MPRILSAWPDAVINLAVMLVMVAVITQYNKILGSTALLAWSLLVWFAYERRKDREKKFKEYSENVIGNFNDMMYYAMTKLPEGIIVVDEDGRLQWCNTIMQNFADVVPQQGMDVESQFCAYRSKPVAGYEQVGGADPLFFVSLGQICYLWA